MKPRILIAILALAVCFVSIAAQQVGMASFYAKNIRGKMANGQRYHKDSMICAHRTYPFGTLLKITHLRNHKTVIVKVTDRGPFGRGRVIDISWGAAEKLGMIAAGVAKVKVERFTGEIDSEIDTHPNDSTDLLIDYEDRDYELPFLPQKRTNKTESKTTSKPSQKKGSATQHKESAPSKKNTRK